MWLRPSKCFPNDSVVSLKKTIHILAQENTPYAFEGTFTGYNESEPDRMFDVTIVNFGPFPPPSDSAQYWLHVYNLTEGCGGEEVSIYQKIPGMEQASYRHFYIDESATARTNCPEIRGYGRIDITGILTVDYLYRTLDTWEERSNRFVGTRKPS